jgi:hypothetical protein
MSEDACVLKEEQTEHSRNMQIAHITAAIQPIASI